MKRFLTFVALSIALLGAAFAARAGEAEIRRALEPKLGGVRIDGIQPAPLPGLFEVRFRTREGMQIWYTDANGVYLIEGNLYEAKSEKNLTEERIRKLTAIDFESLPLDLAVRVQRGNGKRVMAIFADPYCPACLQFEKELAQVDDLTLFVFMFPVIRPELADHSRAVWCSQDRARAWLDLAQRHRKPVANAACRNPVDQVLELGGKLNIRATPTMFLSNGERISGVLAADRLRALLDEAGPRRVATK
jgi:thiol:disulfide interchange protein DsbC